MTRWQYKNLQFQTVPTFGVWSRVSDKDLTTLAQCQAEGWEVYHTVNIRGLRLYRPCAVPPATRNGMKFKSFTLLAILVVLLGMAAHR